MPITRETFDAQRRPRFGTANPERMRLEFWEWMIRGDDAPPPELGGVLGEYGLMMRNGILKSGYGPYRARDLFQVPMNRDDGPVWTFDRMGATRTELPDGRVVCVGGEHEDSYDPDFHIYNDVVVFDPDGGFEIYGFPKDVFPPTDFHTASLVGDRIVLVGCLGDPDDRRPGHTPVFTLDPATYRITPVETRGPAPGWLFRHNSTVGEDGIILVKGGTVAVERDGKRKLRRNFDDFTLDPRTGVWQKLTDNRWRQFSIRRQDRDWFPVKTGIEIEEVYPADLPGIGELRGSTESSCTGYIIDGDCGLAEFMIGLRDIELVVYSRRDEPVARLAEAVRAKLESRVGHPCVCEEV